MVTDALGRPVPDRKEHFHIEYLIEVRDNERDVWRHFKHLPYTELSEAEMAAVDLAQCRKTYTAFQFRLRRRKITVGPWEDTYK